MLASWLSVMPGAGGLPCLEQAASSNASSKVCLFTHCAKQNSCSLSAGLVHDANKQNKQITLSLRACDFWNLQDFTRWSKSQICIQNQQIIFQVFWVLETSSHFKFVKPLQFRVALSFEGLFLQTKLNLLQEKGGKEQFSIILSSTGYALYLHKLFLEQSLRQRVGWLVSRSQGLTLEMVSLEGTMNS